jgi:predicted nuclease with TOPRIM domain
MSDSDNLIQRLRSYPPVQVRGNEAAIPLELGELLREAADQLELIEELRTTDEELQERVSEVAPWTLSLPKEARLQFEIDLIEAANQAWETRDFPKLIKLINEWRETANVYRDPVAREYFTTEIPDDDDYLSGPLTVDHLTAEKGVSDG